MQPFATRADVVPEDVVTQPAAGFAGHARRSLSRINGLPADDQEVDPQTRRSFALGFPLLAVVVGFSDYVQKRLILRNRSATVRPARDAGLWAMGMVAALHARRLIPLTLSRCFLLSFVMRVAVPAAVVQWLLGRRVLFGIRGFAPAVWLGVVLLIAVSLTAMRDAMGLWGGSFVVLAVPGLLMQIELGVGGFRDTLILEMTGRQPETGGHK